MIVSPGLEQRQKHRLVRLAAGVRLHVGEAAAEEPLRPLDGEVLGDVDILAAAIVAPARIALGIFVGHHRALRLEHGARHDVLRRDQLDLVLLATELRFDGAGDLGIGFGERGGEERLRRGQAAGRLRVWHLEHPVESRNRSALPHEPQARRADSTVARPRKASAPAAGTP